MGFQNFKPTKREVIDPLTLAFEKNFDSEVNLVRTHAEHIYARDRTNVHDAAQASLYYAICLLESGEVEKAERIIRKVLTAQEVHEGNIHFGNFKWIYEDDMVTDLNAVQFVLQSLLTIYKLYLDKLSEEIKGEMRRSIGFGLRELENLDVDLSYTNITLLEIMNLIVGGELLNQPHFAERGYRKLDSWIDYTNRFGIREYNSPTYTGVDLGALASISMFSENEEVRLKAKLAEERLWLDVATHYHKPSHQIAGPHSRAYPGDIMGRPGIVKLILYAQLGEERLEKAWEPWIFAGVIEYNCPEYLRRLLSDKPLPYFVAETWNAEDRGDMYTYMTPKYALGTSSIGYGTQTDNLILHYKREEDPGFNIMFCRYIINDKDWRKNPYVEEGVFFGAQHKNKAMALYGLPLRGGIWSSLKTDIVLMHYKGVDQILVNDKVVEKVPVNLEPLDTLLVKDGEIYLAVRPLEHSNLGFEAPITLNENHYGDLVLSIYNYKGDDKSFWEYGSPKSAFYKGNIKAGFIFEVGDADEYGSFKGFRDHISKAYVKDVVNGNKVREVTYKNGGGDALTIKVDLLNNVLLERRINDQVYVAPMLEGTTVKQSTSGYIEVDGAVVHAGQAPAWLFSDMENGIYVAVNPSAEKVPIRLITPHGMVETDFFSYGKIVYCSQKEMLLEIEAIRLQASVYVTKPCGPYCIRLNGCDATDKAEETMWKGRRMLKIGPD
ncbi:MAG: hypothetical protein ACETV1_07500 [Candidatus Bathyarchaeia archaeon]